MALAATDQAVPDAELGATQRHKPVEEGAVLAVPLAVGSGCDGVVATAVARPRAQAEVAMRLQREVGRLGELVSTAVRVQVDCRPVVVTLRRLGELVEADPQVGGGAQQIGGRVADRDLGRASVLAAGVADAVERWCDAPLRDADVMRDRAVVGEQAAVDDAVMAAGRVAGVAVEPPLGAQLIHRPAHDLEHRRADLLRAARIAPDPHGVDPAAEIVLHEVVDQVNADPQRRVTGLAERPGISVDAVQHAVDVDLLCHAVVGCRDVCPRPDGHAALAVHEAGAASSLESHLRPGETQAVGLLPAVADDRLSAAGVVALDPGFERDPPCEGVQRRAERHLDIIEGEAALRPVAAQHEGVLTGCRIRRVLRGARPDEDARQEHHHGQHEMNSVP